jgi:alginate O-acetyltransferase complex protein AlgI
MLFNSFDFAVFFPVVTLLYFLLPPRARVAWLVAASCWFYMAFVPKYLLILFGVILIDYTAGRLIAPAQGTRRRWYLALSIVANVGLLSFFKYFNFFQANAAAIAAWFGHPAPFAALQILLPIGLSFHTFQSMSYTIEVYRGRAPAERSILHFACYVLFYPQLVAGPIERPQNLLPQFHAPRCFDSERLFTGLRLMATGLFKKIIIADRLAPFADAAYTAPAHYSGADLLIATYFFAVQIYCDFSGYSDIARGAARVMGIDLMENFNRPYLAASFADFWRRWHISLSTWFRDYLYIPLGGNRAGHGRRALNLLAVFAVSGLWHGANWTFLIWGLLHGVFLITELAITRGKPAAPGLWRALLRGFLVFNVTCLAWVFFRATDLASARLILTRIVTAFTETGSASLPGPDAVTFWCSLGLALVLFAVEAIGRQRSVWATLDEKPRWQRWTAYYVFAVAFAILALTGPQHSAKPFIYFQF